jgi:hypothetical protein
MIKEELSDVLSEFARTIVTDFQIQRLLDCLVGRIVDINALCSPGIAAGDARKVEVEQQPGSRGAMSLNVVM